MKRQIFGRKEGSGTTFELLIESPGAKTGSPNPDLKKLRKVEIANTRRAVNTLREKFIEGYVLFEGDATRYVFTSKTDFQYPPPAQVTTHIATRDLQITAKVLDGVSFAEMGRKNSISGARARQIFFQTCHKLNPEVYEQQFCNSNEFIGNKKKWLIDHSHLFSHLND